LKKYIFILILTFYFSLVYCDLLDIISNTSEEFSLMNELSKSKWFSVKADFFIFDKSRIDYAKKIAEFLEIYRQEPEIRKNMSEKRLEIFKLTTFFTEELDFFGWNNDNIRLLLKVSQEEVSMSKKNLNITKKNLNVSKKYKQKKVTNNKKSYKSNKTGKTDYLKDFKFTFLSEFSNYSNPSQTYNGILFLADYSREIKNKENTYNIGIQNDSISFDNDKRLNSFKYNDIIYRLEWKMQKNTNTFKIGRGNETELQGLLFDNFTTDRIGFSSKKIDFKILSIDKNKNDYNGKRFSTVRDLGNTYTIKYKIDKEKTFNFGKISGIDTNNDNKQDNSFIYLGGSYKKSLKTNNEIIATIMLYDYEKLNPLIGLIDSQSLAMKINYKKEKTNITFTTQQSGFAYTIGSESFERYTSMETPLFTQLGFNGNVIDFNIIYRPDKDNYIKFETMKPETKISGTTSINILAAGKNFNFNNRNYNADICYIDKEDTTGFFNGSINNMFGWQNIGASDKNLILRITTDIKF